MSGVGGRKEEVTWKGREGQQTGGQEEMNHEAIAQGTEEKEA